MTIIKHTTQVNWGSAPEVVAYAASNNVVGDQNWHVRVDLLREENGSTQLMTGYADDLERVAHAILAAVADVRRNQLEERILAQRGRL